jgi:hypothetical protein
MIMFSLLRTAREFSHVTKFALFFPQEKTMTFFANYEGDFGYEGDYVTSHTSSVLHKRPILDSKKKINQGSSHMIEML